MKWGATLLCALVACAHANAPPAQPHAGAIQVEDAVHGVRYRLPGSADLWTVSREGNARSTSGVEAEVSSFPMPKETSGAQCRAHARSRLSPRSDASAPPGADVPRDEKTSDSPAPGWTFLTGPSEAPVRNRWAFFARGADCLVLHVSGAKDDTLADETFDAGARSFEVLPLSPERQREVDMLAGTGFLERRDPASALDRFEALTRREPENAKAHFLALMAGFELGQQAYARVLPHGRYALMGDRDLSPEQRQLALRALGVMQLAENQVKDAAETLAELVVRAPDLAEGQYNYACALARLGDQKGALDHLKVAVNLDAELAAHARDDEDFKSLRGSPQFEQLTASSVRKN